MLFLACCTYKEKSGSPVPRYGLEYSYFIIFTDALRFVTGPMHEKLCFAKTVWCIEI
jgi:hypothetical protein